VRLENFVIPAYTGRAGSFVIPAQAESFVVPAQAESFVIPAQAESFVIPAQAESFVIPAQAGIQSAFDHALPRFPLARE
jgi:hypothetical protein